MRITITIRERRDERGIATTNSINHVFDVVLINGDREMLLVSEGTRRGADEYVDSFVSMFPRNTIIDLAVEYGW